MQSTKYSNIKRYHIAHGFIYILTNPLLKNCIKIWDANDNYVAAGIICFVALKAGKIFKQETVKRRKQRI